MANLKGPGGMSQLNLIASWKDSQVTTNDKTGEVNGVFLTVQKDQSMLTQKDAKEGKADTNPYLTSETKTFEKDGQQQEYVSHTLWYSKKQWESMTEAGTLVKQDDGTMAVAFKADVHKSTDKETKKSRIVVCTPKDLTKGQTGEALAKDQKYNEDHRMSPSDNKKIDSKLLARQEKITALAKANRPSKEAAMQATAELSVENDVEMEA